MTVAEGRFSRRRRLAALAAVGVILATALGTWAVAGDLPFVGNPFRLARVPAFLQPGDPVVEAARRGASGATGVVERARDGLRAALPSRDALWGSGERYGFKPQDVDRWMQAREVVFRTYPPFSVPENPTWAEDPNDNISWEADYQSLTWLLTPERAYQQTGDPRYLQQVRELLLDWIADSAADPPPSVRTWYDDAVSRRTNVIVSLLTGDLWGALDAADLATVLGSLEQHGQLLRSYLDDKQFRGHNHNLFHALSLYNLATAFPSLRGASKWEAAARKRISTLLPEMVGADGASLEGAPWYHTVALQTYATAAAFLARRGSSMSADEMATLRRMVDFAALVVTPTGMLPPLGDTPYGSNDLPLLEQLAGSSLTGSTLDFVLSRGAGGTRPPDAAFFPDAGYAILRPAYSPGDAWADDLQVIVDTSNAARTHGHADALSVLLTAAGAQFLTDSGGPYLYGNSGHAAFTGAAAHNTVIDVGRTGGRGRTHDVIMRDAASDSVVAGTVDISGGAELRRAIVLIKPDLLVVVDLVQATDGQPHEFRLLYHLPPEAATGTDAAGTISASGARLAYAVAGSTALTIGLVRGQGDPLLGWVTTDYAVKVPAPVLTFTQPADPATGRAWFVSAFQPAAGAGPSGLQLASEPDGTGGLAIHVTGDGVAATIAVPPSGDVTVQVGEP